MEAVNCGGVAPFGFDSIWRGWLLQIFFTIIVICCVKKCLSFRLGAANELEFTNSLKKKMAVLLGVAHMFVGNFFKSFLVVLIASHNTIKRCVDERIQRSLFWSTQRFLVRTLYFQFL
jgi:biotin transporter BioY